MVFAALTGVPFLWTCTRVPAASAFLCSREIRSFLEIGMLRDVCVVLEVVVEVFGWVVWWW
jgi:hypothetical protein